MENQTYAFILKKVIDSCGDEVLLYRGSRNCCK